MIFSIVPSQPTMPMGVMYDELDEPSYFDEKSTRKMMGQAEQRRVRAQYLKFAKASNSKRKQAKRSKASATGPAKRHGGNTIVAKMSARDYDKLKQSASLLGNDPKLRREVGRVYRRSLELQAQIDEIRATGDGSEGDIVAIGELERNQEALLRDFDVFCERHAYKSQRATASTNIHRSLNSGAPSGRAWADFEDDEDVISEEGFWGMSQPECFSVLHGGVRLAKTSLRTMIAMFHGT